MGGVVVGSATSSWAILASNAYRQCSLNSLLCLASAARMRLSSIKVLFIMRVRVVLLLLQVLGVTLGLS